MKYFHDKIETYLFTSFIQQINIRPGIFDGSRFLQERCGIFPAGTVLIHFENCIGHCLSISRGNDLYSCKNLAYNVVNTMDTYSCIETLFLAMTRYGIPEIFNSD